MKKHILLTNALLAIFCASCSQEDFDAPTPPLQQQETITKPPIGLSPEVTQT